MAYANGIFVVLLNGLISLAYLKYI